jgi:hypothetical protein
MKKGFNITAYFPEVAAYPHRVLQFERAYNELTADFLHPPVLRFPGGQTQAGELSNLANNDPFLTNPYTFAEEFAELCLRTGSHAAISFTLDYEMMMRMGVKTPGKGAELVNWRDNNLRLLRILKANNVPIALIQLGNELYMNELVVGTKFRVGSSYNPTNVLTRMVNITNRNRQSAKQLYDIAAREYVKLSLEYIDDIRRIERNAPIAAIMAEEENAAYIDWNTIILTALRSHVDYFAFQLYQQGSFRSVADIEMNLRTKLGRQVAPSVPKVMTEYWWQHESKGMQGVDMQAWELYVSSIDTILPKYFDMAFRWRLTGEEKPGGNTNVYNAITVK